MTRIKECQKEEEIVKSEEMVVYLQRVHDVVEGCLNQANSVLYNPSIPQTPTTSALKSLLLQLTEAKVERRLKFRETKEIYESKGVAEFAPLEWTEDKLHTLLPCLNPDSPPPALEQKLHQVTRERDALLVQVEDLKRRVGENLDEVDGIIKALSGSVSLDMGTEEMVKLVSARRIQVMTFQDSVESLRRSKDASLKRVEELSNLIDALKSHLKEETESRTIIESFEETIRQYMRFRELVQSEIVQCSTLREQSTSLIAQCAQHGLTPTPNPNLTGTLPLVPPALTAQGSESTIKGTTDNSEDKGATASGNEKEKGKETGNETEGDAADSSQGQEADGDSVSASSEEKEERSDSDSSQSESEGDTSSVEVKEEEKMKEQKPEEAEEAAQISLVGGGQGNAVPVGSNSFIDLLKNQGKSVGDKTTAPAVTPTIAVDADKQQVQRTSSAHGKSIEIAHLLRQESAKLPVLPAADTSSAALATTTDVDPVLLSKLNDAAVAAASGVDGEAGDGGKGGQDIRQLVLMQQQEILRLSLLHMEKEKMLREMQGMKGVDGERAVCAPETINRDGDGIASSTTTAASEQTAMLQQQQQEYDPQLQQHLSKIHNYGQLQRAKILRRKPVGFPIKFIPVRSPQQQGQEQEQGGSGNVQQVQTETAARVHFMKQQQQGQAAVDDPFVVQPQQGDGNPSNRQGMVGFASPTRRLAGNDPTGHSPARAVLSTPEKIRKGILRLVGGKSGANSPSKGLASSPLHPNGRPQPPMFGANTAQDVDQVWLAAGQYYPPSPSRNMSPMRLQVPLLASQSRHSSYATCIEGMPGNEGRKVSTFSLMQQQQQQQTGGGPDLGVGATMNVPGTSTVPGWLQAQHSYASVTSQGQQDVGVSGKIPMEAWGADNRGNNHGTPNGSPMRGGLRSQSHATGMYPMVQSPLAASSDDMAGGVNSESERVDTQFLTLTQEKERLRERYVALKKASNRDAEKLRQLESMVSAQEDRIRMLEKTKQQGANDLSSRRQSFAPEGVDSVQPPQQRQESSNSLGTPGCTRQHHQQHDRDEQRHTHRDRNQKDLSNWIMDQARRSSPSKPTRTLPSCDETPAAAVSTTIASVASVAAAAAAAGVTAAQQVVVAARHDAHEGNCTHCLAGRASHRQETVMMVQTMTAPDAFLPTRLDESVGVVAAAAVAAKEDEYAHGGRKEGGRSSGRQHKGTALQKQRGAKESKKVDFERLDSGLGGSRSYTSDEAPVSESRNKIPRKPVEQHGSTHMGGSKLPRKKVVDAAQHIPSSSSSVREVAAQIKQDNDFLVEQLGSPPLSTNVSETSEHSMITHRW
ncbi:hypothetical protein HK102_004818 [Quaeritorhiza haematococci]|nr:hypothetical protein HK102_004818 [Quaeritorhiza haematococci]